jgi:hypothetical protein
MGSILENIEPNQFALLVSLFAIAISDGLSADENTSLGSFVAAVGDTIVLIGAQQLLAESRLNNSGGSSGGC